MRSASAMPFRLQSIETAGGALRQLMARLTLDTRRQGLFPLTREANAWLQSEQAGDGLLTAFIRHTSASLTIQENADPSVQVDLLEALDRFAPQSHPYNTNPHNK